MIIYKATNKIDGKCYIGKTIRPLMKRWRDHCGQKIQLHDHFHNAIKNYGKENFILEVIEEVDSVDLLNEREIYWIDFYDTFINGYNMTIGGDGCSIVSDEQRRKMCISRKGKKPNLGNKHSNETKGIFVAQRIGRHWYNNGSDEKFLHEQPEGYIKGRLMVPWMKGKKHSEGSKEKNRQSHLGKKRGS